MTEQNQEIRLDGIEKKSFAVQVDTYNSKYNELREKAKTLRKEGKDTYIAELHMMGFKAKIHIAEITRGQRDLDVVKRMLLDAEKYLAEAESEKMIDVKREIEEGVRKMREEEAGKQAV